jgi:DNA polymerase elongation subunit (family B)
MHAAIITSKARIKLYKTFQDISKNNGRLLYCDTDSVFVAYKKNVIGETHGNIK